MQMRQVEVRYLDKNGVAVGEPEKLQLTESQCVAVANEQGTFVSYDGYRLRAVRAGHQCRVLEMVQVTVQ